MNEELRPCGNKSAIRPVGAFWKLLFELPPKSGRRFSNNKVVNFFLPSLFSPNSDDTFIYYLCAKATFYVTLVVLLLHLLSLGLGFSFDLGFFEIVVNRGRLFESFSVNVAHLTATLIITVVVPFYVFKVLYNLDPKKVDVLWWYKQVQQQVKTKTWAIVVRFLPFLTVLVISLYKIHWAVFFIVDPKNLDNELVSAIKLLLPSAIYLFFNSFVAVYVVFSIVVLYRYVGKRSSQISSNWIIEGDQR